MTAANWAALLLGGHLLWCLVMGLLLWGKILRWERGVFPLVVFVPCWGTLGVLLAQRRTSPARQWSAAGSVYEYTGHAPLRAAELPCRAEELVPLEEALLLDPAAQRRKLMLLLLADDPAQNYALLELARRNRDSEVAHYAATAMAQAGKRADQDLERLRQAYEAVPKEETAAAYRQQLQQMLDNGVVEGRAADLLRQQLETLLQAAMQQAPAYDLGCQLAETQLALRNHAAAGQTITDLLHRWPQRETPWLLRLRWAAACRDGAALRIALQESQARQVWFSAAGREILQFWQGNAQEEQGHETSH